jgi:hypothetical protein
MFFHFGPELHFIYFLVLEFEEGERKSLKNSEGERK